MKTRIPSHRSVRIIFSSHARLSFIALALAASFLGIVFDDARIASIRIKTGDVAPGPNGDAHHDIVMMDDFIYGEPQLLNYVMVRFYRRYY